MTQSAPVFPIERRRRPRAGLRALASLFHEDQFVGHYPIHDLSAGGARLEGEPSHIEDAYEVRLSLPDGTTLRLAASVVRRTGAGLALRFDHDPAAQSEDQIHAAVLYELELARTGRGVLVVEDFAPVRRALVTQLRMLGFEPLSARNFQEACNLLERRSVPIGAALLDYDLGGRTGLDVAAHVASARPNARRVLMSGRMCPGQLDLAVDQGLVDGRLSKPWTEDELINAVSG